MSSELDHFYLSEGTPGHGASSHKADLASVVLGRPVMPLGVRGPEPNYPSCEALTKSKFEKFHESRVVDATDLTGRGIEWVADVTVSIGQQGMPYVIDARKQTGIPQNDNKTAVKVLSERVANTMRPFGRNHVVLRAEAGIGVGYCDYDTQGVVAAVGIVSSFVTLAGNPLANPSLVAEYVEQSPLGAKHFDRIPLGIDAATLVVFLLQSGWYSRQGFSNFSQEDIVSLPRAIRQYDPKKQDKRLEFYRNLGRIPEGAEKVLSLDLLLGLLDVSFNFPDSMTHAVLSSLNGSVIKPGNTIWKNTIKTSLKSSGRSKTVLL